MSSPKGNEWKLYVENKMLKIELVTQRKNSQMDRKSAKWTVMRDGMMLCNLVLKQDLGLQQGLSPSMPDLVRINSKKIEKKKA